ncbi:hypothetical protein KJE20_14022 [Pyrenophora tritici-repentis]|nr:hypothetical protein KJE20_14123 [Pyrenophora tritici-repentis]KAI1676392.1 hypothetical protein KJE20_14022 [Pyrenophora tritici-repentis]
MLSAELMRDRIASLKKANEAATKRRQQKIYELSARLISRLLTKSVKEESDQVSAARL